MRCGTACRLTQRYKTLADWVLPTEAKPILQLAGVFRPLDVLGIVDQKDQPQVQRAMLGGRFEAPCLELVASAKAAGKLDELAERILKFDSPAADDLFRKSRIALLAVVQVEQGKDAEAADNLKKLLELTKKMAPDAPESERWPDLIAVVGTLSRHSLC